jgi:hypothetical protein
MFSSQDRSSSSEEMGRALEGASGSLAPMFEAAQKKDNMPKARTIGIRELIDALLSRERSLRCLPARLRMILNETRFRLKPMKKDEPP